MTISEIKKLSDEELIELSLQRNKRGFTHVADLAYLERKRRSGRLYLEGVPKTCPKNQNDLDYYGYGEINEECY